MLRAILTTLVFVCSFALAQDRAVELLEGARIPFIPQEVRTLEATLEKTLHIGGKSETTKAFYFIDLAKERFYAERDEPDVGLIKLQVTPNNSLVTVGDRVYPEEVVGAFVTTMRNSVSGIVAAAELIPADYQNHQL